eukprot:TRINITY_DN1645_c0_g1_i1.p1 TRINITY_DN1645_c0_g1~~TRINITY_DN1645_c0_g1_i1.p1  ORF type:complete len:171 (+),score=44.67 TRINITY_DN1645_c0_g1_i1:70-582(+)
MDLLKKSEEYNQVILDVEDRSFFIPTCMLEIQAIDGCLVKFTYYSVHPDCNFLPKSPGFIIRIIAEYLQNASLPFPSVFFSIAKDSHEEHFDPIIKNRCWESIGNEAIKDFQLIQTFGKIGEPRWCFKKKAYVEEDFLQAQFLMKVSKQCMELLDFIEPEQILVSCISPL